MAIGINMSDDDMGYSLTSIGKVKNNKKQKLKLAKVKKLSEKSILIYDLKRWINELPSDSNKKKLLEKVIKIVITHKSPEEIKEVEVKAMRHGIDWANDKW